LANTSFALDSCKSLSQPATNCNFHVGWTVGAGLEVGLLPNWSVKAEYLFIDLASESYGLTLTNNGLSSNLVRFGVNYRF
jgi:outer membrane immunogenic protein